MFKVSKIIFFILAGLSLQACNQSANKNSQSYPATAQRNLLLQSVTIVDTRTGQLSESSDVLISNGKIVDISPAAATANDTTVEIVDAKGKFLVPGYLDMHAHPLGTRDISGSLELMLANGITGYRQMSATSELLEKRKKGELPTKQKKEGADFIKVVAVTPEVFFVAQAEAKRLGLPFVGHVPEGVDVVKASELGMKSMEHLGPGDGFLIACSHDVQELKKDVAALPPLKGPPFKIPFIKQITAGKQEKMIINPLMPPNPEHIAILQKAIDSYTEDKNDQLAEQFVKDKTWQVPTLIRLRTMQFGDAKEYSSNPNLKYIPKKTLDKWIKMSQDFTKNMPESAKKTYRNLYNLQLKLVKIFEEKGVNMMTGDDFGGGWVVAGFGLHQEFDELEKAGLKPLTVLQMTTINGAEFLGRTADMGTVEKGKNANLVLLDSNPILSIQNLHKIYGVVRAGKYYSQDQLEGLKKKLLDNLDD